MAKVHLLNVREGDCTVIEHNSDRITMIDLSCGNVDEENIKKSALTEAAGKPKGNFRMCARPTNPIVYAHDNGIQSIWRFVLSHPDMDHMDGFSLLSKHISLTNFWDSGARKEKPAFEGSPYREEDWNDYVKVRDGNTATNVVHVLAGDKFKYANTKGDDGGGQDGLEIVAPNKALIDKANKSQEFNDSSYVIVYQTAGHKFVFPGDAHDETWEFALNSYPTLLENCSILLAPHHGRKSGRSYEFLDALRPRFSILGCAPSEHLAYSAWQHRELGYVTQNQVGNCVIETEGRRLNVYIENDSYAGKAGGDVNNQNSQGYYFLGYLDAY